MDRLSKRFRSQGLTHENLEKFLAIQYMSAIMWIIDFDVEAAWLNRTNLVLLSNNLVCKQIHSSKTCK